MYLRANVRFLGMRREIIINYFKNQCLYSPAVFSFPDYSASFNNMYRHRLDHRKEPTLAKPLSYISNSSHVKGNHIYLSTFEMLVSITRISLSIFFFFFFKRWESMHLRRHKNSYHFSLLNIL